MKVGIYSGTFDPVHEGHIAFARQAIREFDLDKVFLLPEPRPRRKQGIKAFEHRVNMLKIATKKDKKLGVIILEQPRFTPHETLPLLNERFKGAKIYMLMGDDLLDHFTDTNWPQLNTLLESLEFIIGLRKYDTDQVKKIANIINETNGTVFSYQVLQINANEVSSQKIKEKIKKHNTYLGLERSVVKYIKDNRLYSGNVQS